VKKRVLWISIAVVLITPVASCAGVAPIGDDIAPTPKPLPLPPVVVNRIAADSAFHEYAVRLRERWVNHKSLPDEETLLCVYGAVDSAGVAHPTFLKPTHTLAMGPGRLAYSECPKVNPQIFGRLQYLGTMHIHNGGVDCGFSEPDDNSFAKDEWAMIDIVVCSKGLHARAKRRTEPVQ
jgi:hypothetical protein